MPQELRRAGGDEDGDREQEEREKWRGWVRRW